jgi:hypothetical protein
LWRFGCAGTSRRVGLLAIAVALGWPAWVGAAEVYIRAKITEPGAGNWRLVLGGHRHEGPQWFLPDMGVDAEAGRWSGWVDLTKWPLHGRIDRAGGLAEWPSVSIRLQRPGGNDRLSGCRLEVQIADRPEETAVVIAFGESSESDTIAFLLPSPLREHVREFETGSQMTARHLQWAREVAGERAVDLRHFDVCTTLWGHYDPGLARQSLRTLRLLGFNVVNGAPTPVLREAGVHVLGKTWDYLVDPDEAARRWGEFRTRKLPARMADPDDRWEYENMRHLVIADEVKTLSFEKIEKARRDQWFRGYLRDRGANSADLGQPIDAVEYPLDLVKAGTLPRQADPATRRLALLAARFGQWWSARQLRRTTDEIHRAIPGMKSETLPASHGFFDAWGPPHVGMSAPLLDLFEVASEESVDVLSAEDWLGLNHMYGPAYTWTGAQSFEYLGAIMRSAIGSRPIKLLGLITPSDDRYLRLKAFSCLGQGARAFYFWTFGPTYIGTENYWSDLRSEYEGIHRFTRDLARAEETLSAARPVPDRVAILYSVSHDLWYPDQPAAFVEKRLTWHALRHLGVQPDFLCEADIEAGRLEEYQALFIVDWCISRKASAAIDAWIQRGGVAALSAAAATRDEFCEPFRPPFADAAWDPSARPSTQDGRRFNERTDLPELKPMTLVDVDLGGSKFRLPVLGCRLDVRGRGGGAGPSASFEDGKPAGLSVTRGKGQVVACGFMPMLAYGQLARFQPKTLAEKWPEEPRRLVQHVLDRAKVIPAARPSVPVVEASLLRGPRSSAIVLANYTYEPIRSLSIDVRMSERVRSAASVEGARVEVQATPAGPRVTLPLEWTDIVVLEHD